MNSKKDLVYVAHPYGGDPKNVEKIKAIIRKLREENPNNVYISPVLCFGFYYNDVPYLDGIEECLTVLDKCDFIILCGDWEESRGCNIEYIHAGDTYKPIFVYKEDGKLEEIKNKLLEDALYSPAIPRPPEYSESSLHNL